MEYFNLNEIMTALRAQYITLVEKGDVVLFIIDRNGKIEFASYNIEKVLFYRSGKLIGKNIIEITELNSIPKLNGILKNKIEEPVFMQTFGLFCSKCLKHYFDGIIMPYQKNSRNYFILYLHNITQRKLTEDRLKELNKELDSFIYKVSHDLKSPLNSIQGMIQLMTPYRKDSEEYLGLLDKSVDRLKEYITQLANYSRNESKTEIKAINFDKLIKEIFENYQFMPNAEKIRLNVQIDQRVAVYSDEFRLQVILNNIISNAIKYHNFNQNDPYLNVHLVEIGKEFNIVIKDNGTGIEEKHISSIFEMFQRATVQSEGSGLGLYIVKKALDKLNGRIDVKSEIGTGTTFIITVPNRNPEPMDSKVSSTSQEGTY